MSFSVNSHYHWISINHREASTQSCCFSASLILYGVLIKRAVIGIVVLSTRAKFLRRQLNSGSGANHWKIFHYFKKMKNPFFVLTMLSCTVTVNWQLSRNTFSRWHSRKIGLHAFQSRNHTQNYPLCQHFSLLSCARKKAFVCLYQHLLDYALTMNENACKVPYNTVFLPQSRMTLSHWIKGVMWLPYKILYMASGKSNMAEWTF